ncbi:hypothetical protein NQZ68_001488 [Dissostichus eleginoides]|nr:hypothetical protein NQZ68_001488 [Dissostichus eleginoides]
MGAPLLQLIVLQSWAIHCRSKLEALVELLQHITHQRRAKDLLSADTVAVKGFFERLFKGNTVRARAIRQPRRQQQAIYRIPAVWSCDLASEQCSQVTNKTLALTGARLQAPQC